MWKRSFQLTWKGALFYVFTRFLLIGGGSFVKVLCQPGQPITLPCVHYHGNTPASQLSVQWRSPRNELLCHYIKHKTFQNCTLGYTINNTSNGITLTIQRVKMKDLGSHVCSVSKPHEFSDHTIELAMVTRSITSAPQSGLSRSSKSAPSRCQMTLFRPGVSKTFLPRAGCKSTGHQGHFDILYL